eukprot:TRINITY_DN30364_c0_g1_i1.p1 TRINITY_DN30364_c0_g1~~TRINITY_DN30364_c0_g1_i1.p1  ORF type:complete len:834 (-),score=106.47 TRINITY_DN30364_c0_g1_i1:2-2482(-)
MFGAVRCSDHLSDSTGPASAAGATASTSFLPPQTGFGANETFTSSSDVKAALPPIPVPSILPSLPRGDFATFGVAASEHGFHEIGNGSVSGRRIRTSCEHFPFWRFSKDAASLVGDEMQPCIIVTPRSSSICGPLESRFGGGDVTGEGVSSACAGTISVRDGGGVVGAHCACDTQVMLQGAGVEVGGSKGSSNCGNAASSLTEFVKLFGPKDARFPNGDAWRQRPEGVSTDITVTRNAREAAAAAEAAAETAAAAADVTASELRVVEPFDGDHTSASGGQMAVAYVRSTAAADAKASTGATTGSVADDGEFFPSSSQVSRPLEKQTHGDLLGAESTEDFLVGELKVGLPRVGESSTQPSARDEPVYAKLPAEEGFLQQPMMTPRAVLSYGCLMPGGTAAKQQASHRGRHGSARSWVFHPKNDGVGKTCQEVLPILSPWSNTADRQSPRTDVLLSGEGVSVHHPDVSENKADGITLAYQRSSQPDVHERNGARLCNSLASWRQLRPESHCCYLGADDYFTQYSDASVRGARLPLSTRSKQQSDAGTTPRGNVSFPAPHTDVILWSESRSQCHQTESESGFCPAASLLPRHPSEIMPVPRDIFGRRLTPRDKSTRSASSIRAVSITSEDAAPGGIGVRFEAWEDHVFMQRGSKLPAASSCATTLLLHGYMKWAEPPIWGQFIDVDERGADWRSSMRDASSARSGSAVDGRGGCGGRTTPSPSWTGISEEINSPSKPPISPPSPQHHCGSGSFDVAVPLAEGTSWAVLRAAAAQHCAQNESSCCCGISFWWRGRKSPPMLTSQETLLKLHHCQTSGRLIRFDSQSCIDV